VSDFLGLFHRYGYIYKPLSRGSWYSADEKWRLSDSEILKAIAGVHPKFLIGCRAGKTTRFAVLDIDKNSRYHNERSLRKLLHLLDSAGLSKSSLYRSSYSEGWHLYLFFDEPLNSAELRRQLVKLLTLHDFQIAKGHLEIFPHPGSKNSLGLGLRLPLQEGFAWLDKRTLDVDYERHELTPTQALELFIDAFEGDPNSYQDFRQLKSYVEDLEARKKTTQEHVQKARSDNVLPLVRKRPNSSPTEFTDFVTAVFSVLPPGIIIDNWYNGRLYHLNGLTGPSQRAEAITCLGHYLFYGDPSRGLPALGYGYEQERQWAIDEFLRHYNNGHSKDINADRADAFAQVERAANWIPPHKRDQELSPYKPNVPVAWTRNSANLQIDARSRIKAALEELIAEGNPFSLRDLTARAHCHHNTLKRHADLWKADYDAFCVRLETASCEYNVVVGAASSESKPPTTSQEINMPPGRLAARRIAYELSMRSQRERKRREADLNQPCDWRESIKEKLPADLDAADIQTLKPLLVFLIWQLSLSPSHEDQVWLSDIVSSVRWQLKARSHAPRLIRSIPP